MDDKKIKTLDILKELKRAYNIPFAYDHFAEREAPNPPFIVYMYPDSDNFGADGRVYYRITRVNVELYTDHKDLKMEGLLEQAFDGAGIFWDKTETWISDERLYEVVYEYEEDMQ